MLPEMNPVPCYHCFFWTPAKARRCLTPVECKLLDEWLTRELETVAIPQDIPEIYVEHREKTLLCPQCHATELVKAGTNRGGQRYRCKKCRKSFTKRPGFAHKMKTRTEVIDYAQLLASQDDPAFSGRDIAQKVEEKFQVKVSHVTVANWLKKK